MDPLEQKRTDTAFSLFGAVSVILNNQQLNIEDKKYLIEQLVRYYVYYYQYVENVREGGCPPNTLNRISLKAKTAKSNVTEFFKKQHEVPQIITHKLFPYNND